MEDFFEKIRKKLSVDNILDLMKDGKLKEEIKQTLTGGVNLNDMPRKEEGNCSEELKNVSLQTKKPVTVENVQQKASEEQSNVIKEESQEQLAVYLNEIPKYEETKNIPKENVNSNLKFVEEKKDNLEPMKQTSRIVEAVQNEIKEEPGKLNLVVKEESKEQPDDKSESNEGNLNVQQKPRLDKSESNKKFEDIVFLM